MRNFIFKFMTAFEQVCAQLGTGLLIGAFVGIGVSGFISYWQIVPIITGIVFISIGVSRPFHRRFVWKRNK